MRYPLLFLVPLALSLGLAGPVLAHSKLKSSVPANGATVPGNFKEIRLDFIEPVEAALSHFELIDSEDKLMQRAEGANSCEVKSCRFAVEPLAPGKFRVDYHILSADGHVVDGHIGFTVKAAP